MSKRPLSPLIGRAPSRTSFMPFQSAGLWLAVKLMPPASDRVLIRYEMTGVGPEDLDAGRDFGWT